MKKINFSTLGLVAASLILSVSVNAEEMDHSKHQMPQMDHSKHQMAGHDMSQHAGHDTGAVAHIHHSHGKGAWMFEYRYMTMDMDGLLRGTDSVTTKQVSGVTPQATGGMQCAPDGGTAMTPRLVLEPGKSTCMAPTNMTMSMNMFMAMYGLSDKISLMGMINYLKYEMDMVMHMSSGMTMTGDMETSGWSDIQIGGMYTMTDKLTLSMNVNLPTGATDERVNMTMRMPTGAAPRGTLNMRAPYAMQLGSGTLDLLPAITLKDGKGNLGYGAQMTYTLRTGDNDEGYNLGNRFDLMGWVKYAINKQLLISTRLNFMDWDKIDGADSNIMAMMNTTNNPNNYGGSRVDLLIGASGFYNNHMFGIEFGVPVQQDLNGVQMETESILNISYQLLM